MLSKNAAVFRHVLFEDLCTLRGALAENQYDVTYIDAGYDSPEQELVPASSQRLVHQPCPSRKVDSSQRRNRLIVSVTRKNSLTVNFPTACLSSSCRDVRLHPVACSLCEMIQFIDGPFKPEGGRNRGLARSVLELRDHYFCRRTALL
ncbi:hypothetical protein [Paraburkholderia sp. GAS42]|uniref:hypothetical protein n=1 Tax=Paraburkholderia sp. GAS42 TaxID=3035135 RepID=UPI003D255C1D